MSGVEIRVRSNSLEARQDLSRLERSVSSIDTRVGRATRTFRNLALSIGATFSGAAIVGGINKATDSLTNLENRIALVTGRGDKLNATLSELFEISKGTRSSVTSSAQLFGKFGLALRDAGVSSEDLLLSVTSVNKALAISGSDAQTAAGAITQLGQGIAAGALRGEELNSVLEGAPRLAQAIADSLEVPFGSLRALAAEGKLTSDVVFGALLDQAETLNSEFETLAQTGSQAFLVLREQIGRVTGEVSQQVGITQFFIDRANALSDAISLNRGEIVANIVSSFSLISGFTNSIFTISTSILSIISALGSQIVSIANQLVNFDFLSSFGLGAIDGVSEGLKEIANSIRRSTVNLDNLRSSGARAFRELVNLSGRFVKNLGNTSIATFEAGIDLAERTVRRFAFSLIKLAIAERVSIPIRYLNNELKFFFIITKNIAQSKLIKFLESVTNTFVSVGRIAKNQLSGAWSTVETFLNLIERKFYWVYDKVIGNSWWTDTMEQVFALSQQWLPQAFAVVSSFASAVGEKFKAIYERFSNLNFISTASITIKDVDFSLDGIKSSVQALVTNVAKGLSEGFDGLLAGLDRVSPILSAALVTILTGAVVKALSPSLFAKTFGLLGPVVVVGLALAVGTGIFAALSDSTLFARLGDSIGTTIGTAFAGIVTNIPFIIDSLIQGLSTAGAAFAESVDLGLLTLPAKLLSSLPGGGLLTALLYGGVAAAIFFKGFRTLVITNVAAIALAARTAGGVVGQGASIMDGLLFGGRASVFRDQAIGASGTVLTSLQASAKKAQLQFLGVGAALTVGFQAALGDVIGPELAFVLAAVTTPLVDALLFGQGGITAMTAKLASIKEGVGKVITFASVKLAAIGAGSGNFVSTITAALTRFNASTLVSTRLFTGSWFVALTRTTAAITAWGARNRATIIKTAAVLGIFFATTVGAFAGDASAVGGSAGFDWGTAFIIAGGLAITAGIGPLLAKLGTLFTGATFAPALIALVPAIAAVTAALAALAAIGAVGFTIYSAFFGEGDTFKERVESNGEAIGRLFGLITDTAKGTREAVGEALNEAREGLQNLNREIIDISDLNDITLSFNSSSLINLSQGELITLRETAEEQVSLARRAAAEERAFGRVTENTRQRIEENTRLTADLLRDPNFGQQSQIVASDISNILLSELSDSIGRRATRQLQNQASEGVGVQDVRITEGGILGVGASSRALSSAESLFFLLESGNFDFADPQSLAVFAEDSVRLFGDQLPTFLEEILNALGRGVELTGREVDAFRDALRESLDLTLFQRVINAATLGTFDVFQPSLRDVSSETGSEVSDAIQDSSAERLFTSTQAAIEAFFSDLEALTGQTFDSVQRQYFSREERSVLEGLLNQRDSMLNRILEASSLNVAEFLNLEAAEQQEAIAAITQGLDDDTLRVYEQLLEQISNLTENFATLSQVIPNDQSGLSAALGEANFEQLTTTPISTAALDDLQERLQTITTLKEDLAREELTLNPNTDRIDFFNRAIAQTGEQLALSVQSANIEFGGLESQVDRLQGAFSRFADDSFDMNRVLALDAATLNSITDAQTRLELLNIELIRAALLGDNLAVKAVNTQIMAVEDAINALVDSVDVSDRFAGSGGGGDTETVFEKLVGGLNAAGFSADIEELARLSGGVLSEIQQAVTAVTEAQEALTNASLDDVDARRAALATMEAQRDVLLDILSTGNLETAQGAFSDVGLDENAFMFGERAVSIQRNILELREQLSELSVTDFENISRVNALLETQERIYENITEGALSSTEAVSSSIKDSLSSVLSGAQTISEGIMGVLDTVSMRIIDTVVNSFVDAFLEVVGFEDFFKGIFEGLFDFGNDLGKNLGSQISGGLATSLTGTGSGGGGFLSNLFSGIFGGGGGGKGTGGGFLGFLGLNDGGIVPTLSTSRRDVDSVPAMLTPGELVVPANRVDSFLGGGGRNNTTVNLNITGDISRQTKTEIMRMIPQISAGVNMTNKENNYRG